MSKLTYIRKYYPMAQFIMFLMVCVLVGGIPALQIIVERNLIDTAILGVTGGAFSDFSRNIGIFVVLILSNSLLASALQYGTEQHLLVVGKKLDTERLKKIDKVSFQTTETQAFHELYERAEKAADLDSKFYAALQTGAISSVQIVTSFIVLFSIDTMTAIVIFILLLLGIAINRSAAQNTNNFWGEYIQNMRHANYLSSLLLHREYAAERKIFNFNQEIENRYYQDSSVAIKKNNSLGEKRFHSESAATRFSAAYSILTVLLLVRPVNSGQISLGSFIAAFTAISSLRSVANQLYGAVFDASSNFMQLSGFFSFLQLDEEKNHGSNKQVDLSKGIEFQHVSFTYPGTSTPVLDDVSFTLKAGGHYALVGENGCGKTTLVKLLLGLYQPTKGCITAGGKDVAEMCREEKRQLFSAIFQDFYRYPLSVKENVSLGAAEIQDSDRIKRVLGLLNFDAPFLSRKDGMDMNLNLLKKESVDLSGGEWQKLTVARSVISPAPIVVLDEPNAALGPMSEAAFYRVYEEMLSQKTTLFISHRLGSVKSADSILILHNKHLIAMDTHDTLMNTCEYYRELFETQRGLYYEANT